MAKEALSHYEIESLVYTVERNSEYIGPKNVLDPIISPTSETLEETSIEKQIQTLFNLTDGLLKEHLLTYRFKTSEPDREDNDTKIYEENIDLDNIRCKIKYSPSRFISIKGQTNYKTAFLYISPSEIRYGSNAHTFDLQRNTVEAVINSYDFLKYLQEQFQALKASSNIQVSPENDFFQLTEYIRYTSEYNTPLTREKIFQMMLIYWFKKSGALDRRLQRIENKEPLSVMLSSEEKVTKRLSQKVTLAENLAGKLLTRYNEDEHTGYVSVGGEIVAEDEERNSALWPLIEKHATYAGMPVDAFWHLLDTVKNRPLEPREEMLLLPFYADVKDILANDELYNISRIGTFHYQEPRMTASNPYLYRDPEVQTTPAFNPSLPSIETEILVNLGVLRGPATMHFTVANVYTGKKIMLAEAAAAAAGRMLITLEGEGDYREFFPKRTPDEQGTMYFPFFNGRDLDSKNFRSYAVQQAAGTEIRIQPFFENIELFEIGHGLLKTGNHWVHNFSDLIILASHYGKAIYATEVPEIDRDKKEQQLAEAFETFITDLLRVCGENGIRIPKENEYGIPVYNKDFHITDVETKRSLFPYEQLINDLLRKTQSQPILQETFNTLIMTFQAKVRNNIINNTC